MKNPPSNVMKRQFDTFSVNEKSLLPVRDEADVRGTTLVDT